MKRCPFCSEEIQTEAIKCRYCGEMLGAGTSPSPVGDTPTFSQVSESAASKSSALRPVFILSTLTGYAFGVVGLDILFKANEQHAPFGTPSWNEVTNRMVAEELTHAAFFLLLAAVFAVTGGLGLVWTRLRRDTPFRRLETFWSVSMLVVGLGLSAFGLYQWDAGLPTYRWVRGFMTASLPPDTFAGIFRDNVRALSSLYGGAGLIVFSRFVTCSAAEIRTSG